MAVTFRYLTNKQWGMTYVQTAVRSERQPDVETAVHHTAGNPYHNLDAAVAFRRLNELAHADGYWCVPYDIIIHEQHIGTDRLVTIGEGRGPWMSGATKDRNEEAEAVCAMGYFHPGHSLSERPSQPMLEGIARGIVHGMNMGWIAKKATIYGHRDNPSHPGATACPGDYLWQNLPMIKARVHELLSLQEYTLMHGFMPRHPSIAPRFFDTRGPAGANRDAYKLGAGTTAKITVPGGIGKDYAIINIVATEGEANGYFTAWPNGLMPNSSVLNWTARDTIANEVTVELADDGSFQLFTSARVHVVLDLVGYYDTF